MFWKIVAAMCFFVFSVAHGLYAELQESPEIVAEVIKGKAFALRQDKKLQLEEGDTLYAGDDIFSREKTVTIGLLERFSEIEIKKYSELEIISKSEFRVLKGDVKPDIKHGELVIFELPLVRLATLGTEFLIRVKPDITYVGVTEGELRVKRLDSESEETLTMTRNLMLRSTQNEPLKMAPLPEKPQTSKWLTIGACAAVGIGGYLLIDHLAGGTDPIPAEINSLQDAINAAIYVVEELDLANTALENSGLVDTNITEAQNHIGNGRGKASDIQVGGKNMRDNMQLAKNVIAIGAAAGIVFSAVRLIRDRNVYREIEDPKLWLSLDPDLLREDPSLKVALNLRF